jgi:hypothetical protein
MLSFLFIFPFIANFGEASLKSDCNDFKTGKFALTDKASNRNYEIERNDSLQIETDLNTGRVSKFDVTWISDCEYELRIREGGVDIMNFYKNKVLTIRIIETYKNSYKFEGQVEGMYKTTQILKRIK